MTLKELQERVRIDSAVINGTFCYSILYRGSWEHTASSNVLAYNTIKNNQPTYLYTPKQAYQTLWDNAARHMRNQY